MDNTRPTRRATDTAPTVPYRWGVRRPEGPEVLLLAAVGALVWLALSFPVADQRQALLAAALRGVAMTLMVSIIAIGLLAGRLRP